MLSLKTLLSIVMEPVKTNDQERAARDFQNQTMTLNWVRQRVTTEEEIWEEVS